MLFTSTGHCFGREVLGGSAHRKRPNVVQSCSNTTHKREGKKSATYKVKDGEGIGSTAQVSILNPVISSYFRFLGAVTALLLLLLLPLFNPKELITLNRFFFSTTGAAEGGGGGPGFP